LIFSKESEESNDKILNIQTTITTETPKINRIKKIVKKNENLNIEKNNKIENLINDMVKVILGVSGSGKTHHIINKIYENKNNYLIYMSCGDVNIENKQFADYCTQYFINRCETFEIILSEYVLKKNKTCIEKRKIMVNFIFYYFLDF
jgi:ABC-type proline/glycine betaine transport system ATPase subunit